MLRFALFLTAAAIGAVLWTLYSFNHFSRVENDFSGVCAPVSGVPGPEDIHIDHAAGRAFVSSLDRRALTRGERVRGAIYSVNLSDPLDASGWVDRTRGAPEAFQPAGLYYYRDATHRRLFAVNAANKSIEVFDVAADGDLTHLETLAERRLTAPNDIVAVGPRAFYVTNGGETDRDSLMGRFEYWRRAAAGGVLYFNGTAWRSAANGLRFADGVNVNADATRLYVAETAGKAVKEFVRDPDSGALTYLRETPLSFAPNNISVDVDGALWVAGAPKPLAVAAHRRIEDRTAPSAASRLRLAGEGAPATETEIEPVFVDRGETISGATIAARFRDTLVIGAPMENKFLLCSL
ncbi:MAG: SMP-30/gluconolactonase/LRE family protein [Pseudomonadota bacterium]